MKTKTLFQVSKLFNVSGYTIYQWCLDCELVEHTGNFLLSKPNNFVSIDNNGQVLFTQLGVDLLEACFIK